MIGVSHHLNLYSRLRQHTPCYIMPSWCDRLGLGATLNASPLTY